MSNIVVPVLSVTIGLFFVLVGTIKLTPFISEEFYKEMVGQLCSELLFLHSIIHRAHAWCISIHKVYENGVSIKHEFGHTSHVFTHQPCIVEIAQSYHVTEMSLLQIQ